MAIQSLGIGSGLLTSDLIDKIVAAERSDTDTRMTTKKSELDAKISAFGAIQSSVDALRTAAKALGDSSTLLVNTATSSDSSVAATATNKAQAGVHTVEVSALARAHTLLSKQFNDVSSVVGSGTLTFNFGTTTLANDGTYQSFTANPSRQSASIVIDDSNDTLTGVRDAINAADIGVTANIVNDGSGYRLVLSSDSLGASNSMQITATEGTTAGLSAIAFNATASTPDTNMTQTVAAADAQATIDGIPITRTTNSVSDVVTGLTFNLQATNAGSPSVITVSQDTSGIGTKVQAFVDAFNDVRALTDKLTAYDATNNQPSLLTGDPTVLSIRNQLQRLLATSIGGTGSVKSLVDLGVTSDQDNQYYLVLDQSKLQSALAQDPSGVQALLASQTSASDPSVNVVGFTSKTTAGSYAVNVTQLATHGTLAGASLGAGAFAPITIGDTNDNLSVSIDGVASGSIALTHGTYANGNDLAKEIQTRINADSTLKAANVTASVSFNAADNHFEIASTRYGSTSSVGVNAVDSDTLATLGFTVGAPQAGLNVAGTINGVNATGSGQFLVAPNGPLPALSGYVQGGVVGDFTTPLTIDATNDNFAVRVDGIASGTITLTDGAYASGAALATEMQTRINADSALTAAGVSVTVTYDASQRRFTVSSASKGIGSSVGFTNIAAGVTTALGFGVGVGTNGRDAAAVADSSAGMSVQITGGALGDRGTVTLVRGVMNRIDQTLTNAVSTGGVFDTQLQSFDAQEASLAADQDAFDKRMTALQTRLQTEFANADALISTLNNTSTYLSQQFDLLNGTTGSTKKS